MKIPEHHVEGLEHLKIQAKAFHPGDKKQRKSRRENNGVIQHNISCVLSAFYNISGVKDILTKIIAPVVTVLDSRNVDDYKRKKT